MNIHLNPKLGQRVGETGWTHKKTSNIKENIYYKRRHWNWISIVHHLDWERKESLRVEASNFINQPGCTNDPPQPKWEKKDPTGGVWGTATRVKVVPGFEGVINEHLARKTYNFSGNEQQETFFILLMCVSWQIERHIFTVTHTTHTSFHRISIWKISWNGFFSRVEILTYSPQKHHTQFLSYLQELQRKEKGFR